ncbi:MAG TPA: glycosyltransferase [Gemmatimonadales bacterium]|nr:glycosyltransferase [Gemmatimonadales bacterium]
MSPRVSVVTTVYNGEPYVDRAIPGILAQTFRDFEWIVVNDGSTDRTREILEELAGRDSRIRVFSPGRLGITAAANFGVSQATGEYIARQDFDDRSYPDRLQLQVELLDAHPEVGVVGGYFVLVDENRNERYVRMPPTEHNAIVSALAKFIVYANTTTMFRRVVWTQAGGYPEVSDLEDQLLWLRAAKLGWRFATVPEVVGEHFVHSSSFFHRAFKYADRQRNLARVQAQVIRELGLPKWMYLFALGRYVYAYSPVGLKRMLRRKVAGSEERDV